MRCRGRWPIGNAAPLAENTGLLLTGMGRAVGMGRGPFLGELQARGALALQRGGPLAKDLRMGVVVTVASRSLSCHLRRRPSFVLQANVTAASKRDMLARTVLRLQAAVPTDGGRKTRGSPESRSRYG